VAAGHPNSGPIAAQPPAAAAPAKIRPVPSVVAPSLKVTVPVAPLPVTVAVKVTDWPKLLGLAEELTEVVEEGVQCGGDELQLLVRVAVIALQRTREANRKNLAETQKKDAR